MQDLLLDIIAKTMDYTKVFIAKFKVQAKRVKNEVIFEERKSDVINVMYNPIFEKKETERNMLLSELENIRREAEEINQKIGALGEENSFYKKSIEALNTFQEFLLERRV